MSSGREIEPPYTLATLPKPIDSVNGHTVGAPVYSLSGSKVRKRTEVAVGVDGEGILIYALQNPHLATSYALPPQTYFTAAPCSVYRKGSTKRPLRRFTYASITQSSIGQKPQIVGFLEETQKEGSLNPAKYSFDLPSTIDRVTSIQALPIFGAGVQQDSSHDVVILAENGETICLSSDLKDVRWTYNLKTLSFSKERARNTDVYRVEHASLLNAKAVCRGLLKSRDDIAAILDPTMDRQSEILETSQVLCVVTCRTNSQTEEGGRRTLELYQLLSRSVDTITSHRPEVEHLLTWNLPQPTSSPSASTSAPFYSIHPSSGILHQLVDGAILSYDFSGTVPRRYSELEHTGSSFKSFARMSSDLLLAVTENSCGLYDVKYSSVQGITSLSTEHETSLTSRKRKHSSLVSSDSNHAPILVTCFADIGLVVGVFNHELKGIQIHKTGTQAKSAATGSLLIDSIGKGLRSKRAKTGQRQDSNLQKPLLASIEGSIQRGSSAWQHWEKRVVKLDEHASNGDIAKFEEMFASELGIGLVTKNLETQNLVSQHPVKPANGVERDNLIRGISEKETHDSQDSDAAEGNEELSSKPGLLQWRLPKTIPEPQRLKHRHKAIYALGKIFSWTQHSVSHSTTQEPSIAIEFFPPNVFQWLLLSGYLTKELIQSALMDGSSDKQIGVRTISGGEIVRAIVRFDPDLRILYAILNQASYFPIDEVVEAIKQLIQSLEDSSESEYIPQQLTNGTAPSEEESDTHFESELEAATHDLDHALSILDEGLLIRSQTLRPALIRLHSFPSPLITSTLRRALPHTQLLSLVRLLYLELKGGGWTSPYYYEDSDFHTTETTSEDPSDQAIAIIASLLSCTLDALGAGGWLAAVPGSEADDPVEEMIHDLYEEATLALNGFWEARFMRGLLSEFLRFAWKSSKNKKPKNETLLKQGKPILVDAWQEGASDSSGLPMLPLGGNIDAAVSSTKVGRGGKADKRSAREMGMLISKRVPKYSFERIVI